MPRPGCWPTGGRPAPAAEPPRRWRRRTIRRNDRMPDSRLLPAVFSQQRAQRGLWPQPKVASPPVADVGHQRICAACEGSEPLWCRGHGFVQSAEPPCSLPPARAAADRVALHDRARARPAGRRVHSNERTPHGNESEFHLLESDSLATESNFPAFEGKLHLNAGDFHCAWSNFPPEEWNFRPLAGEVQFAL
jgi:hypothetical protein